MEGVRNVCETARDGGEQPTLSTRNVLTTMTDKCSSDDGRPMVEQGSSTVGQPSPQRLELTDGTPVSSYSRLIGLSDISRAGVHVAESSGPFLQNTIQGRLGVCEATKPLMQQSRAYVTPPLKLPVAWKSSYSSSTVFSMSPGSATPLSTSLHIPPNTSHKSTPHTPNISTEFWRGKLKNGRPRVGSSERCAISHVLPSSSRAMVPEGDIGSALLITSLSQAAMASTTTQSSLPKGSRIGLISSMESNTRQVDGQRSPTRIPWKPASSNKEDVGEKDEIRTVSLRGLSTPASRNSDEKSVAGGQPSGSMDGDCSVGVGVGTRVLLPTISVLNLTYDPLTQQRNGKSEGGNSPGASPSSCRVSKSNTCSGWSGQKLQAAATLGRGGVKGKHNVQELLLHEMINQLHSS